MNVVFFSYGYNIPPTPHFEIMTIPDGVLQKIPLMKHFGENSIPIAPSTYYPLEIKPQFRAGLKDDLIGYQNWQ